MLVKIIPHGALRETWPCSFECDAATPLEAMTALTVQFKLGKASQAERWVVRLVGYDSEAALNCPLTSPELHIVPDFSGGGGNSGGFLKIVIGVVLVAVAIVATIYTGGAASPLVAMAISGAFSAGASLILGGILSLMSPAPKSLSPNQNGPSAYLGAPKNTTAIGTPIPICFGRYQMYGQFISFDIEANDNPINGSTNAPDSSLRRLEGIIRPGLS